MLRYRLRGGDRPSSLAHTGDALLDADATRPGYPAPAPASGAGAGLGGGAVAGRRGGGVELCQSDLAYHHNLIRSVRCYAGRAHLDMSFVLDLEGKGATRMN